MTALSSDQRAVFDEALDLLARKLAEDEVAIGADFPYVTGPDGTWRTLPASLSAAETAHIADAVAEPRRRAGGVADTAEVGARELDSVAGQRR